MYGLGLTVYGFGLMVYGLGCVVLGCMVYDLEFSCGFGGFIA